ncbi:NACHT, LRR and PYD domains-containing protein 1 homolog [Astyanax mexicanus]|uniref:NACHT, LRR and PYD domains-containing protein 1 homolog n=1 Tax=Astyanax mexicanus TaxID=7994 RepID=UPI0020CB6244|nr:NACHT, LRR and PYD domains-containing protein 1 homolog [Astyanax mexicanus]
MSSSLWTSSWRTCEFCSVFVDHEHWQPFEPTRVTAVDETVKYRISVTRGSHECRVTGLRWQSFCNVELEYSLGDWDLYSDLLEKKGFVPCGPLMDLRVISGQLAAVHLPHFICLDTQHRWRDFRMLCAEDTGVSLEDCLISQFHAVQFCHTFIPMGVLVSSGVPVKAHCDILIYLSSTAHQTLHVYLIPGDVKMKESVEKREKGSVKICTWPDVSLQMKQHYTLSTSCSSQITPQKLKLRYTSKTPNFFKVNIKEVTKHSIDLQLLSEKKTVVRQAYIQSDIIQGPAVSESSPAVLKRSKGYETPVVKIKEKSEARSERAADQKKVMEASEQFGKWWKSSCRSCSSVQDTAEWKHIEPEADENLHYRVSSSAGRYECSVSGLRWVTEGDVSLKYNFADWKPHSEDLRRMQFEPCGPLMDITVISGRIVEVHLPHFACLGSSPALTDVVRVLDVQDDGMFLEKCELTRFHAKLLHPTFSPKGFLIRSGFPVKVHCEVLIYQTLTSLLTLHVYLVTCDLNSIQEVEKKEKDAVKILKPGPERSLPMKSWYNIETKFKSENFSSTIKPKRLKLRYSPIKYCEVYTKNPDDDFELHLINERKESIWDGVIRTDEYRRSSSFTSNDRQSGPSTEYAVWFVTTHRNALIKGVSLVNPIADDLNELIGEEKYSIITECKTPQKQMRKIYSFLCGGQEIKRKFYESLLRHEPHLVADLTGAD